tara:strand:+ start:1528 stop:2778 length:1251 start_codon:yes stop_codon:yes gene_type:complete
MNIVYINHYAGSPNYGMEYRTFYLAREWVKKGNKVNICASSFSHVRNKNPKRNNPFSLSWTEEIDGIYYNWYLTPRYIKNGLKRFINIISFLGLVLLDTKRIIKDLKPDIIIASSTYPLDIWVAKYISKKSKCKLVFELHDIWPLSQIEINKMKSFHPFILLCSISEKVAYENSDLVISMLPCIDKYIEKRNFKVKKLDIIPNGFYTNKYLINKSSKLNLNLDNYLNQAKEKGKMIIVYCGSHGLANSLDNLLDAAKLLKDKNQICFCIVGNGLEKKRLEKRVIDENLTNVKMFNHIKIKNVQLLLSKCNCCYIGAPKSPLYKYGISPNKLLDYMYAQLPIISTIEAGNDIVSEAKCGISIPSENPLLLSKAITKFSEMNEEEREKLGINGKLYIEKYHSYESLSRKFLQNLYNLN